MEPSTRDGQGACHSGSQPETEKSAEDEPFGIGLFADADQRPRPPPPRRERTRAPATPAADPAGAPAEPSGRSVDPAGKVGAGAAARPQQPPPARAGERPEGRFQAREAAHRSPRVDPLPPRRRPEDGEESTRRGAAPGRARRDGPRPGSWPEPRAPEAPRTGERPEPREREEPRRERAANLQDDDEWGQDVWAQSTESPPGAAEPGRGTDTPAPPRGRRDRDDRDRLGRRGGHHPAGDAPRAARDRPGPLPGAPREAPPGPAPAAGRAPGARGDEPPETRGDEPPEIGAETAEPAWDEPEIPQWIEPGPDIDAAGSPAGAHDTGRHRRPRQRDAAEGLLPAGAGWDPTLEEGAPEAQVEVALPVKTPRPASHKRILINASDDEEVRIAVIEDGQLEELYYERPNEKKYLGNIYKGKVVNLEPGIQAAFVDIGIGRNGFLHVSDILPAYKDSLAIPLDNLSVRFADRKRLKLQEILRKGQEVLVQISKDAIGAKGPSLTTYVSIPGKYLVLMPGVNRHGVSKRIQDDQARSKLRDQLTQLNPPKGMGFIIRTAGHEVPQGDLERDFQYLMKAWEEVRTRVAASATPSLIHAETDLVTRSLRDLLGSDVAEILVDDPTVHDEARKFVEEVMPQAVRILRLYSATVPLFNKFHVEEEIEKIYNRRVPLPSGGYIVLEQTEALVAIDVNSGKYRDEEDLEATALKTNLEAAQEIARQLRLRDLGGVIVNDFIDMESEPNRRAVERALRVALKRDRAKSWISRISRFGIIEMTRQRVRPSFERSNHEPCSFCRGTGVVKSARSSGIAILRQLQAALGIKRRDVCEVVAHPSVVDYLVNCRRKRLVDLEKTFGKTVQIRTNPHLSPDQYEIKYH